MDNSSVYFPDMDTPMTTKQIISANIQRWVEESSTTLKKIVAAAQRHGGAGYGTVQRAHSGEHNLTIEKMEAIARTFRRSVADLVTAPTPVIEHHSESTANIYSLSRHHDPLFDEAVSILAMLKNDHASLLSAVNHLKVVASEHQVKKEKGMQR
jgi:hypothetical protein